MRRRRGRTCGYASWRILACSSKARLLFPALRRTLRGAGQGFAAALVLCALIAAADEAHKALIPGRHCSWDEAGLNVLGAFLGAGAVLIAGALRARRKKAER